MKITKNSVDDILLELLKYIQREGEIVDSTKGRNKEILGVYIVLNNPLNRISKSLARSLLVSPIGEFFWYLSGSNKLEDIEFFISKYKEYSNDGIILNGAYGERMFGKGIKNQVKNIINLLRRKNDTRQAVIQLFNCTDLENQDNKDVPCTCTLQFIHRNGKLDMFVNMRSNDLFVGFPHDVFCFTMLQELIANELSFDLGKYHHFVSSLHIYEKDFQKIENYCKEGYHSTRGEMMKMPADSLSKMNIILSLVKRIRLNQTIDFINLTMEDYWRDLLIILQMYSYKRSENMNGILSLYRLINTPFFKEYIQNKYSLDEE